MKISRNAPCHCGSGRKYKKCCADSDEKKRRDEAWEELLDNPWIQEVREELAKMEASNKNQELFNFGSKDMLNDPVMQEFNRAFFSMHQRVRAEELEKLEHVKKYRTIRNMHQKVVDDMIVYFKQGKFEQKFDHSVTGEYLSGEEALKFTNYSFDLDDDLGLKVYLDMQFYKPSPNMDSVTEAFIAENYYSEPEMVRFLQSMLNSTVGLFEVVKIEEETAYVTFKHVFTGEEFRIVDIGLSGSPSARKLYIYTRIITYDGISFGTGLNLIFPKDDLFIGQFIIDEQEDYKPTSELVRMLNLYQHLDSC